MARNMVQDGSATGACSALGRLHPRNAERDLHRWARSWVTVETYPLSVPLESNTDIGTASEEILVVLPHELFAAMAMEGDAAWQHGIVGPGGVGLHREYWERHRAADPTWFAMLGLDELMLTCTVPIYWHEDGVRLYHHEEATIWSWSSALTTGHSLDSKHVMGLLPSSRMTAESEHAMTAILAWSMGCMRSGTWPMTCPSGEPWPAGSFRAHRAGQPLAQGWRAAFAGWKGDFKARHEVHRLRRFYSSNFICERCAASKHLPETLYGSFHADAGWRQTTTSHEDYLATTPEHLRTSWLAVTGFTFTRCIDDAMHIIHLGVARDAAASVMIDALEAGELGCGGHNEALKRIWLDLKQHCRRHQLQFSSPKFTMGRLGRTNSRAYPVLDGQVKAAHVKVLLGFLSPWCVALAAQAAGSERAVHAESRACMIWALARMLRIWDEGGVFLAPEAQAESVVRDYQFLQAYALLASTALDEGKALFKLRPKHHYFCHLLDFVRQTALNPRHTSCFPDEDLMGRIAKLGKACARKSVFRRTMQRYLLLRCSRWRKERMAAASPAS